MQKESRGNCAHEGKVLKHLDQIRLVSRRVPLGLMNINFNIQFGNLDEFIYKKDPVEARASFSSLSRLAHESHASINRRYRKFMRIKRSEDTNINKARAKRCCNMVKKHLHDLKKIRAYLYKHGMHDEHPIFIQKIDGWIGECERIHSRYKHHIDGL